MQLLTLAIIQSLLLAGGQVFLKLALGRMEPFGWNWQFWNSVLTNWQFALCGLLYGAGTVLWFYIIKHFPFSMAYPMISLSYVFGMVAAMLVFHEEVSMTRWAGVLLIMAGCYTVSAQTPGEQDIIRRMSAAAEKIRTVRCEFTQTKHSKMLNEAQVSRGKMFCEQPDKLRWEYTSPKASAIVMDGTTTPEGSWRGAATLIMNSVAGKSLTDNKAFQVSAKEMPTEYVATLVPLRKDMKRIYSKLVLHFDLGQLTVTEVELHEKNGDCTVIELHDIHINEE